MHITVASTAQTISAFAACGSALASAVASLTALRSLRLTQAEREKERRRHRTSLLAEVQVATEGLRAALARHEFGTPAWQERLNLVNLAVLLAGEDLPATSRLIRLARPPSEDEFRTVAHELERAIQATSSATSGHGHGRPADRGKLSSAPPL